MSARPAPRPVRRLGAARAADLLLAGALALAAAGAALVVVRPAPRVPDAPPLVPPPPPAAPAGSPGGAALEGAVVRTNLFSATRTPPRARYVPPGAAAAGPEDGLELAPRAESEPPESPEPPAPRGPDDPPQFYGTIIGPEGPRALLRLDARVPGAQLYAAGQGAGGWRVVRVEPERVVLTVAGGRVTLRLPRPGARRAADSAGAPRTAPDTSGPTPSLTPPP